MGEIMGFIAAAVIVEGILSYVREIVEKHKGEIHYEVEGGKFVAEVII